MRIKNLQMCKISIESFETFISENFVAPVQEGYSYNGDCNGR